MILLFLALSLFGPTVVLSSDADTVDAILTAFVKNNAGTSVSAGKLTFPYRLNIGSLNINFNVYLNNGKMTTSSAVRNGDVRKNKEVLSFAANFTTQFSYDYTFQAAIPSSFSSGTVNIQWAPQVAIDVKVEANKVSVLSSDLIPTGPIAADFVPKVPGRSATIYPKGDSSFVTLLNRSFQVFLETSLNNIVI